MPFKSDDNLSPINAAISSSMSESKKNWAQIFHIRAQEKNLFICVLHFSLQNFVELTQSFKKSKTTGNEVVKRGKVPRFSNKLLLVYPSLAKFWFNGFVSVKPIPRSGFWSNKSKLTILFKNTRNFSSFKGKSTEKRGMWDTIYKQNIPPQIANVGNPATAEKNAIVKSIQLQ